MKPGYCAAPRRPLLVDRRGLATDFAAATPVELDYVERTGNVIVSGPTQVILQGNTLWYSKPTAVKLEMYCRAMQAHTGITISFHLDSVENGQHWLTKPTNYFQTPVYVLHLSSVTPGWHNYSVRGSYTGSPDAGFLVGCYMRISAL